MFEIKKGVPIPTSGRGINMYPFAAMEVGDCFEVPFSEAEALLVLARLRVAISTYAKRNRAAGIRFTNRKDNARQCVTCWRVA